MTPAQVQNALGQHLVTLGKTIVFPNKTTPPPALPYLVMQATARNDIDRSLAGGAGYSEGRQFIVVVHHKDQFATAADALAYQVKQLFPKALRLGKLTIVRSQVLGGYVTDTDYRVPVQIDWIAT